MFKGFTMEALDFLMGIRLNNNKEWFEPRKKIYLEHVYEPMKALGEEIYKPFADTGMTSKTCRIYRDTTFPPHLHYRDSMWSCVRYPAVFWNRAPALYFELSPEGADFGFGIIKPSAKVMERFRAQLAETPEELMSLVKKLRKKGFTIDGEDYKRKKPCSVPETEELWQKKSLCVHITLQTPEEICSPELPKRVISAFRQVMPLNELFHEIVEIQDAVDLLEKEAAESAAEPAPEIKAPETEFMW